MKSKLKLKTLIVLILIICISLLGLNLFKECYEFPSQEYSYAYASNLPYVDTHQNTMPGVGWFKQPLPDHSPDKKPIKK